MKNPLMIALAILVGGTASAHPDHGTTIANKAADEAKSPDVIGHNGLRYRVNRNWSKADPKATPVANAHAMVEDKEGQIYLVTDAKDSDAFIVYEKDGTFVRSFGKGLKGGHGLDLITIDGEEYLIHVDSGWQQTKAGEWEWEKVNGLVTIVGKDEKVLRKLPTPHELGIFDKETFFNPCDVAVTPDNEILVVDGYSTNKVLRYKADGTFVGEWGGRNEGEPDDLQNAHGISVDSSDPANPKVWVSSRAQCKLKSFTLDGKLLETIDLPGALAGQALFAGDKIYTGVCWSKENGTGKQLERSGFVLVLDRKSHRVISAPGGNEPIYKGDELQPLFQADKVFTHVHDLYVDSAGDIYVGEWNADRRHPWKLTLVK